MLFKISTDLPKGMQKVVAKIKRCRSRRQCVRIAYDAVTNRFRGYKFWTYIYFWLVFVHDPKLLWKRKGKKVICTNLNWLVRVLLVNSGRFKNKDIKSKWTMIACSSLHQYLRIRDGKSYINVDPWGRIYGVSFGNYAHGFNSFR